MSLLFPKHLKIRIMNKLTTWKWDLWTIFDLRIVSVLICGENANTESLMTFQPFQDSKSFSELNSSSNTSFEWESVL